MNYATIKDCDIANGEGVRVTLFVSGCNHHCKGCFNQEAWDFEYGKKFDESVVNKIIKLLEPNYIKGLTLLGGEPMDPRNQEAVCNLVCKVREVYKNSKNIWCYSGYVYDKDLVKGGRAYTAHTDTLLSNIDVLVDGPFILEQKNISLKFRGSSNQRIIDMKKTLANGKVEIYME